MWNEHKQYALLRDRVSQVTDNITILNDVSVSMDVLQKVGRLQEITKTWDSFSNVPWSLYQTQLKQLHSIKPTTMFGDVTQMNSDKSILIRRHVISEPSWLVRYPDQHKILLTLFSYFDSITNEVKCDASNNYAPELNLCVNSCTKNYTDDHASNQIKCHVNTSGYTIFALWVLLKLQRDDRVSDAQGVKINGKLDKQCCTHTEFLLNLQLDVGGQCLKRNPSGKFCMWKGDFEKQPAFWESVETMLHFRDDKAMATSGFIWFVFLHQKCLRGQASTDMLSPLTSQEVEKYVCTWNLLTSERYLARAISTLPNIAETIPELKANEHYIHRHANKFETKPKEVPDKVITMLTHLYIKLYCPFEVVFSSFLGTTGCIEPHEDPIHDIRPAIILSPYKVHTSYIKRRNPNPNFFVLVQYSSHTITHSAVIFVTYNTEKAIVVWFIQPSTSTWINRAHLDSVVAWLRRMEVNSDTFEHITVDLKTDASYELEHWLGWFVENKTENFNLILRQEDMGSIERLFPNETSSQMSTRLAYMRNLCEYNDKFIIERKYYRHGPHIHQATAPVSLMSHAAESFRNALKPVTSSTVGDAASAMFRAAMNVYGF